MHNFATLINNCFYIKNGLSFSLFVKNTSLNLSHLILENYTVRLDTSIYFQT